MSEKSIAVLVILAFIGIGIAFAYIGMMNRVEIPSKIDGITGQNETNEVPGSTRAPSKPEEIIIEKNETDKVPELTEEQKEKAKEIALSDPEVKKIVEGKRYEIKVTQMKMIAIINTETKETTEISVNFEFDDGAWMDVFVDLDRKVVTEIGPVIKPQMIK